LADIAFHRAIAQATGNPYFVRTLDFLTQYLTAVTRVTRANEARRLQFMRPFALSRERTPAGQLGKRRSGSCLAART
jgi:GntR family transcriptional repressor for pyruvate dehydrogenase complex